MTMMDVVRIDAFGSRETMKFRRLPIPSPGPKEILLKVKAASVNPVDWKIREGRYPAVKSNKLPYVLGRDVSGVVEACGPETTGHQEGDEIYAMLGIDRGAYAEHVIVKVSEAAPKPTSINHLAAADIDCKSLIKPRVRFLPLSLASLALEGRIVRQSPEVLELCCD